MSTPVYIPFATFLHEDQTTSNFWQVTTTTKHLLTTPSVPGIQVMLEFKICPQIYRIVGIGNHILTYA